MTRVILWKELREQAAILIALLVMGSAVLVAIGVLVDSVDGSNNYDLRSLLPAGRLALVMLTISAGVVVGGTLFAGEREAGTFLFLDRLPASRWAIWWRKAIAGTIMIVPAGLILGTTAGGVGALGSERIEPWLILALILTVMAYGWGMVGSVMMRSSLAACGIGLAMAGLAACTLYAVFAIGLKFAREEFDLLPRTASRDSAWQSALIFMTYAVTALPFPLAAWIYTSPDRSRKLADPDHALTSFGKTVGGWVGSAPITGVRLLPSFRRILWLLWREWRIPGLALAAIAILGGMIFTIPEVPTLIVWPILSLIMGTIVGVVGWSYEQSSQQYRFWGERRLPYGRVWLGKVISGLGITVGLVVLLMIPALIKEATGSRGPAPFVASALGSRVMSEGGFPTMAFLLIWPLYGFVFGHLAGLLFEKAPVAGAVGLLVGGSLAALWYPTFLSGGVPTKLIAIPAFLGIVIAGSLQWPLATNRITSRTALGRIALGLFAILLTEGGLIGQRAFEIPQVAETNDDLDLSRELPTFDEKQAGRDLRRAIANFPDQRSPLAASIAPFPLDPATKWYEANQGQHARTYSAQLHELLDCGYPPNRPDLDQWLDLAFATKWDEAIDDAAKKPLGVLEDPNELTATTLLRHIQGLQDMQFLVLVRALQAHARGKPEAFVEMLRSWLAAIRITRNSTIPFVVLTSHNLEQNTYKALNRWMERLDGRPELLKEARAIIQAHEAADPYNLRIVQLATQVVLRNSIKAPSQWLPRYLDEIFGLNPSGSRLDFASGLSDQETDVVSFCWSVPWERERLRRYVGQGNVLYPDQKRSTLIRGLPGADVLNSVNYGLDRIDETQNLIVARRRGAILALAIRQYEAETGKVPLTLSALVPKYLPSIPIDPFSEAPFQYRVSVGEDLSRRSYRQKIVGPPGVVPVMLSIDAFDAVAATCSTLICWPFVPGWMDPDAYPPGMGTPPIAMVPIGPSDREVIVIKPGQPIVWSVGPDRVDQGGKSDEEWHSNRGTATGDMIFIVPRPSKESAKSR